MSFLWPAGLGFLVLIPPIVLLYFLRLKRDLKVVSSTWLWKRTLDEYRVNRPFQKFQNHLLLWLQLLAIALLAVAVARPFFEAHQETSGVHIVLVDRSASMSVVEADGRSRLTQAKDFLREQIRSLKSSERMMIIGFSDRAEVATAMTSDRDALVRGVETLTPTFRPTRIEEAWLAAIPVARQYELSDIFILSDGGFRSVPALTEANANVRFVPFGKSNENVGIVHLESRMAEESRKEIELFARIANHRNMSVDALVELRVNDKLVDAQKASLTASSEKGVVFHRPATEEGIVEVRIAAPDAFPADNRAWMVLGGQESVRVTLVGEESVFLKQALAANPRVELTVVSPADFAKLGGKLPECDLWVFDGIDPGPLKPGNYLFLGQVPAVAGFQSTGETENPPFVKWESDHPLTRYINFSAVHAVKCVETVQPGWMKVLLSSRGGPIISAGEQAGVRIAFVAFRPLDSDWPLRVSFPLFFSNAIRWAKDEDTVTAGASLKPGEPLSIRTPAEPQEGTVEIPDGTSVKLPISTEARVVFPGTESPGVYTVKWQAAKSGRPYAVSLLDPAESNITVPEEVAMGDRSLYARLGSAYVRREFTGGFVLAAVAILILEWLVYQFRGL